MDSHFWPPPYKLILLIFDTYRFNNVFRLSGSFVEKSVSDVRLANNTERERANSHDVNAVNASVLTKTSAPLNQDQLESKSMVRDTFIKDTKIDKSGNLGMLKINIVTSII